MDQMTQNKTTHHCRTRQGHDCVATAEQRPFSEPAFIGRGGQRSPRVRDVLVEGCEQISSRLCLLQPKRRRVRRSDIQFVLLKGVGGPTGNVGQMRGQASQGTGFFVGLPFELLIRNSLQRSARIRHFLFELRQYHFTKTHHFLQTLNSLNTNDELSGRVIISMLASLHQAGYLIRSLRKLRVLGVSAVNRNCGKTHRRDAEAAKVAQRKAEIKTSLKRKSFERENKRGQLTTCAT